MTKDQELLKQKALDIISDITSVRNPNRWEDITTLIEQYGEKSRDIQKKP